MYRKLVLITTLLTFAVIVFGAYVRLSDAGLGCPDWPGCYGEMTPAHAADEIAAAAAAQPHGPVSLPKAWKEMTHRYLASSLGVLIIAIAVIAYRRRAERRPSYALPLALVALVAVQGLLGMWTVTLLLKPVIVTGHLLGGLTILALLTWITLHQFEWRYQPGIIASRTIRWLAPLGLAALGTQIVLGGWVSSNYAALACQEFPRCQGAWLPTMDFRNAFHVLRELGMTAQGDLLPLQALTAIHWMHRLGALITTLLLSLLAFRLLVGQGTKPLGCFLLAALTLQVLVGIANVYLRLPLALAVAHNAGAALLLLVVVAINFFTLRSAPQLAGSEAKAERSCAVMTV
jgi:cytochrome c oxidase assembly protein subunit 15